MAKRRDPRRGADQAKMRGDEFARQQHEHLLRQEQFKDHFLTIKPNPVTGHTELSAQYDNDGVAIHDEPRGYTKD